MTKEQEETRAKILHILGIYPILSHTMLQVGLGPSVRPALWRPLLADLVEDGEVIEESITRETTYGRFNSYSLLHLPGVEVKGLPEDANVA